MSMKVRDLIQQLQTIDPDLPVVVKSHGYGYDAARDVDVTEGIIRPVAGHYEADGQYILCDRKDAWAFLALMLG